MSPRPILKGSKSDPPAQPHRSHHYTQSAHQHSVHFPPSPSLTRTFLAHSASTYDRSPIVVSPNDCALPERGCPGRTYFEDSPSSPTRHRPNRLSNLKGYHPIAFSATGWGSNYGMPALVPDLSSESDESDGVAGLPPPSSVTFGPHGLPSSSAVRAVTNGPNYNMHTHGYAVCDQDAALAFLPYSPTSYSYELPEDDDQRTEKLRRRRDKKHESSVDPDRISRTDAHITQFAHSLSRLSLSRSPSPSRSPPSTPKKKSHKSSFTPACSDDGCLGGF